MAVRGSSVWWLVFGVTNVSSRTSAAFLNPASRSPYDHSSGVLPIGRRPWSYSAKSAAVHFSSSIAGGDGGWPRSEEHTSELQSHHDLHSFPTRRSSDLVARASGGWCSA